MIFDLTKRQKDVYDFIKRYILEQEIAPTEKEIAEAVGIKSRGVVHRYVHALKDAGLVSIDGRKKRNITLNDRDSARVPVRGEDVWFSLTELTSPGTIAVRAKKNSVNGSITKGDLILCKKSTGRTSAVAIVRMLKNS